MECFLCTKYCGNWQKLSDHFKFRHRLKENFEYRCKYKDCNAIYGNSRSFGRHVRNHLQKSAEIEKLKRTLENGYSCNVGTVFSANNGQIPINLSPVSYSDVSVNNGVSPIYSLPVSFSENSPDSCLSNSDNTDNSDISSSNNISISSNFDPVTFFLNLHSFPNLTRKNVSEIEENSSQNLIQPIISAFKNYVTERYVKTIDDRIHLHTFLKNIESRFKHCSSEYHLINKIEQDGYMGKLHQFTINNVIGEVHHRDGVVFDEKTTKGILLPISFQFQKYFQRNDYLLAALNKIKILVTLSRDNLFGDFITSKLWKEKSASFEKSGKIVLPYFLYIDDVEVNNALGSHAAPVTMVYYSFPFEEKLQIFLAAIIKAKDYKNYGNFQCLSYLVHQLRKLEDEGIAIETSQGAVNVHFVLGLVIGDNLGVNTVLGFSTFNANYFCRLCKEHRNITQTSCEENSAVLRNKENYQNDVAAKSLTFTGINESCVFNALDSFHPTTNFTVDVMHDIFEGVCHYDLQLILHYFIYKKTIFLSMN